MNERLNVRRMQVPESEDKDTFDLERKITHADWENIRSTLDQMRATAQWLLFAPMAANVKLLRESEAPKISDSEWAGMVMEKNRYMDSSTSTMTNGEFLRYVAAMKTLRPQNTILNESQAEEINKWHNNIHQNAMNGGSNLPHWESLAQIAALWKLLQSNTTTSMLVFGRHWKNMEDRLTEMKKEKAPLWYGLEMAANLRILDPRRPSSLSREDYTAFTKILQDERKKMKYGELCRYASRMKILMAEKVEVTTDGLKLTMSKAEMNEKIKPPPEILEI